MRQRCSVRIVCRHDGDVLLLRRSQVTGRESTRGLFELPGGRLLAGEQPEDAVRRILKKGIDVDSFDARLDDAVTYVDYDDEDIQYLVLIYVVELPVRESVRARNKYDIQKWISMSKIQQFKLTDLTIFLTHVVQQKLLTPLGSQSVAHKVDINTTDFDVTIFSDGGSRGNPGHSAAGFVIVDGSQSVIEQGGEYLGITTNGQAEYHGVRLGLERALEMGFKTIDFRVDNLMVANQMNGVYRVKNRELWPIHERVKRLVGRFDKVNFSHVKREYNRLADGMVNQMLDRHADDGQSRV